MHCLIFNRLESIGTASSHTYRVTATSTIVYTKRNAFAQFSFTSILKLMPKHVFEPLVHLIFCYQVFRPLSLRNTENDKLLTYE